MFAQGSAMPPPPLLEDLEEEVLLRFPPEDPAALVRAALVCKRWRRLVSGPGFRRRFRGFHRTPPTLGMFCNREYVNVSHFVSTTTFRPHHAERGSRRVLDARHGRALLLGEGKSLVVWDPITDEEWKVPFPPQCTGSVCWAAAILCYDAGAGGCDHLDCHRRHFVVVFVASVIIGPDAGVTSIYTYSSNAAAWSEPTCGQRPDYCINSWLRTALVGNTLYFGNRSENSPVLKYNMQSQQMSWIQLPCSFGLHWLFALTTTEDCGLQLGMEHEDKLYICIWSLKDANEVDARWEQNRVIKLNTLPPVDSDLTSLSVLGSTDDLGTIFVSAKDVAYSIDLKTCKMKKVYDGRVDTIIPYMSFCIPGTGSRWYR